MKNLTKYFIYIRRSMDDESRQVLSLPAQTTSISKVAKDNNLHLFETIEESKSAKQPGRPEFNRMLDRIEAGEANGILCWDIDRLYRNPIDEGRVRWLLQNGVIQSIRTPGREYTPRDAGLLMAVEGGRAVEHILSMFLHEPPDDVKAFCRAIGGRWKKDTNSRGGFDYRTDGNLFDIIIFDAEKRHESEEVEL